MSHPHERRGEIGGVRRPGPDKPNWMLWIWRVDWLWRRLIPTIALVLALIAVFGLSGKVDANEAALEGQKDSRRLAIEVLCGSLYGVQEAGRLILTGELPQPAPHEPPVSDKERQAREDYALAYNSVISKRVLEEAGVNGREVLRKDGSVDCAKLKMATTPKPAG